MEGFGRGGGSGMLTGVLCVSTAGLCRLLCTPPLYACGVADGGGGGGGGGGCVCERERARARARESRHEVHGHVQTANTRSKQQAANTYSTRASKPTCTRTPSQSMDVSESMHVSQSKDDALMTPWHALPLSRSLPFPPTLWHRITRWLARTRSLNRLKFWEPRSVCRTLQKRNSYMPWFLWSVSTKTTGELHVACANCTPTRRALQHAISTCTAT